MAKLFGYALWFIVAFCMALMIYTGNFKHVGIIQLYFVITLAIVSVSQILMWCFLTLKPEEKATIEASKKIGKSFFLMVVGVIQASVTIYLMESCGFSLVMFWHFIVSFSGVGMAVYCKRNF